MVVLFFVLRHVLARNCVFLQSAGTCNGMLLKNSWVRRAGCPRNSKAASLQPLRAVRPLALLMLAVGAADVCAGVADGDRADLAGVVAEVAGNIADRADIFTFAENCEQYFLHDADSPWFVGYTLCF